MAGAQQQIEATIDALIAKFRAELTPKIDAINLEISDGYPIDPIEPQNITFGPRSGMVYPWISVGPESSENLAEASGRIHYEHAIAATVWVADADEEALVRRLIRYQRAVREVAVHFRRPGSSPVSDDPGGYWLGYVRDVYGPTMQDENPDTGEAEGPVISWARTTFAAKQQQDF